MVTLQRLLQALAGRLPSEQVTVLLTAAAIGVAAAFGALAFRSMILAVEWIFWGTNDMTAAHLAEMPWYWVLLAPAVGAALIAPIVVKYAPEAKGSGIPEVIQSVALEGGRVHRRVAPLKAIAAALTIGSGGSAGREGPIVHIGGAIGSWMAQIFRSTVQQTRTYVGCGVAAGISATFNTPFAGALFAVEVVLGDLGSAKISPIVIASIMAAVISRYFQGNFPHLDVPEFTDNTTLFTVLLYIFLGLVCGAFSALFIKGMTTGWRLAARWPFSPYVLPAAGGLIVGAIGLAYPHVFGVGYDSINAMMLGRMELSLLLILAGAKLIATCATLTTGGSGGVFAPSLFLGAAVGAIVGKLFAALFGIETGLVFVLAGMGAMVAGTTRAPISAILVMFELTYEPSLIVPLMAACIPAIILSSYAHEDSIYIAKLTMKGVRLLRANEINLLKGMPVNAHLAHRVPRVTAATPLPEVVDLFLQSSMPVLFQIDNSGKLTGILESKNIQFAMLERESLFSLVNAEDLASPVGEHLNPGDDLSFAMQLFDRSHMEILPVLDASGALLGEIHRNDVIHVYNEELAGRDELTMAVDAVTLTERLRTVQLADGYSLTELETPAHLAGRDLASLTLRQRCGIQAILIKRGRQRLTPGPDTVLQAGDLVLFAGETEGIEEKLRRV